MSCPAYHNMLIDFHFGVLPPGERRDLERHLSGCQHCLKEFFEIKGDIEMGSAEKESPSLENRKSILMAARSHLRWISLETRRYQHIPRVYWLTASGAAVAAAVLIAVFVGEYRTEKSHDEMTVTVQDGSMSEENPPEHSLQIDTARLVPESLNFL